MPQLSPMSWTMMMSLSMLMMKMSMMTKKPSIKSNKPTTKIKTMKWSW